MPDLGNYQVGTLKSTPKLTRINADDVLSLIYRNMGNNHAYPFVWAETVTVASGSTNATVISGVKFHGMKAAEYCKFCVTPLSSAAQSAGAYISKNTGTNVVSLVIGSSAGSNLTFDVFAMVGISPDVEEIACRGTGKPAQNLP